MALLFLPSWGAENTNFGIGDPKFATHCSQPCVTSDRSPFLVSVSHLKKWGENFFGPFQILCPQWL